MKIYLAQFGIPACALNSELPINSRCHIVQQFNAGMYDIIIASDELSLDDPNYAANNKSNKIVICSSEIFFLCRIFKTYLFVYFVGQTKKKIKKQELSEASTFSSFRMSSILISHLTLIPTSTEWVERLEATTKEQLFHLLALERNILWKQWKNIFTTGYRLVKNPSSSNNFCYFLY